MVADFFLKSREWSYYLFAFDYAVTSEIKKRACSRAVFFIHLVHSQRIIYYFWYCFVYFSIKEGTYSVLIKKLGYRVSHGPCKVLPYPLKNNELGLCRDAYAGCCFT